MHITHSKQNGAYSYSRNCATSPTAGTLPASVKTTRQQENERHKQKK